MQRLPLVKPPYGVLSAINLDRGEIVWQVRAYNKATGKEVGAVWMPAQQSGSPMTYLADGKQYIVVAVSGGNYSGKYIAFAVPGGVTRRSSDR